MPNKGGVAWVLLTPKTMFCLMLSLIDLGGDEFWKASPTISFGRLMPVDCWIECDSVVRTHILVVRPQKGVTQSFAIFCHHGTYGFIFP
jgi:hypothetical protein